MKRIAALLGIVIGVMFAASAMAAQNITMCAPPGLAPNQFQTFTNGTLTPDTNGCITIDLSKDVQGRDMMALVRAGWTLGTVSVETISQGGIFASVGGTTPTVTSCGTGTVATSATNNAGDVTATGATACTVVFATTTPFANKPVCWAQDETSAVALKVVPGGTGNKLNIAVTGLTSGDEFMYGCIGK